MHSRRAILGAGVGFLGLSGCLGLTDSGERATDHPAVRWRRSVGESVGRPVFHDGTLYVAGGTNDRANPPREAVRPEERQNLYAFDTAGDQRWRYEATARVRSVPKPVAGGVHAVVGWDSGFEGIDNRLVRLVGGEREWTAARTDDWLSILGHNDGTTFLGTSHDEVSDSGETLFAVDGSGTERWQVESGTATRGSAGAGVLYTHSGEQPVAIDTADGSVRWDRDLRFLGRPRALGENCYLRTATTDSNDDYRLVAVDATSGETRWGYAVADDDVSPFRPTGVVADDRYVYGTGSDGQVFALVPATGEERWRLALDGGVVGGPTLASGTVYAVTENPSALHAVDAESGARRWQLSLDDRVWLVDGNEEGTLLERSDSERSTLRSVTADGEVRWTYAADERFSRAVLAGTGGYVGTASGDLLALGE